MRRRKRSHDYVEPTWWTRDHGGLPGWALVIAIGLIAGLGVVVVVLMNSPR